MVDDPPCRNACTACSRLIINQRATGHGALTIHTAGMHATAEAADC